MKDPFDNYKKLQDAINRTSRVANLIEMQNQRFEKAFRSAALMPTIPFAYQIYSNHQSEIGFQKLLAEEKMQTEYLYQISESLKSCECNEHIDSSDSE